MALAARLARLGEPPAPTGKLLTAKELASELTVPLDTVYHVDAAGPHPPARNVRPVRFDWTARRTRRHRVLPSGPAEAPARVWEYWSILFANNLTVDATGDRR